MKTFILASAAVLTLGFGSAFAATNTIGFDGTQPAVAGSQTGNATDATGATTGSIPSSAAGRYAYNGQFNTASDASSSRMTMVPATPPGALEAYNGDAMGAP